MIPWCTFRRFFYALVHFCVLLYIKETEFVYQVTNYNKLTEAVESYAELEKAAHTSTGLPVGAVIAIILVAIITLLGVGL